MKEPEEELYMVCDDTDWAEREKAYEKYLASLSPEELDEYEKHLDEILEPITQKYLNED